MPAKPSIGFFSPLPPARTGVADYAAQLLEYLPEAVPGEPGGINLYHLGNNPLHADVYRRALAEPGVVVLHDAVLQHFYLGTLDESAYAAEFVFNYGEWMRDLGRDLWRHRSQSATDVRYFEWPMLRRAADASKAVIVHNRAAEAAARRHAPNAVIHRIPHLFPGVPPFPEAGVTALRETLHAGTRTCLLGVFGYLRESKRLPVILRAFKRARESGANAALLIAGEIISGDLRRAVEPALRMPGVTTRGHLSESDFWKYASAVDACINLRYPPAGETSGIGIRLMGLGKPVIFTSGLETQDYPRDAILTVDAGACEEAQLCAWICWLAERPAQAAAIGNRAAAHIREHHSPARCAEMYRRVLAAPSAPAGRDTASL